MNDAPRIAPKPIAAPQMLLGEGREEEIFLEAFLAHLGITGVQIESCAARATGHSHTTTTNKAKARVHAWLAAQPRPDLRLGDAAAAGLMD